MPSPADDYIFVLHLLPCICILASFMARKKDACKPKEPTAVQIYIRSTIPCVSIYHI